MKASAYPVLDNRPIDQWKVTELREELKRRKLITKGLKEELVRRLDEAIRNEDEDEEEEQVGIDDDEPQSEAVADGNEQTEAVDETGNVASESETTAIGTVDATAATDHVDSSREKVSDSSDQAGSEGVVEAEGEDRSQEEERIVYPKGDDILDDPTPAGLDSAVGENLPSVGDPGALGAHGSQTTGEMEKENMDSGAEQDSADLELGVQQGPLNNEIVEDNRGSNAKQDSDDVKPSHEDVKLSLSDPSNQVSVVSPSLGFPVNSVSITTDSVSINETNDIKDNIIADNVKLELDVKPEMVQSSSCDLVPDAGKSHPVDVEEPHENKISGEETNNNITNADMSKKTYSADLGSSEKLNLDRSSGDDSMEEDALESKQIESTCNSSEVGEKSEKSEMPELKEENPFDAMEDDSTLDKIAVKVENKNVADASTVKRKLSDKEAVLNGEPSKRQRRWNSESLKITEPKSSNFSPATAPKDVIQPTLRRSLSISNSSADNDVPKERVVPPPTRSPTNSLRIDRFLRPFTLKAVQELLGKTGTVASFWMDHIKTHCYVTYSSEEEAISTRNAVYNLQWPPNGGRLLVAEFVDPQEVKARTEAPPPPAAPVKATPAPVAPLPAMLPVPSPRQASARHQQLPPPPPPLRQLPPPPPLPNPPPISERLPPPPPLTEKVVHPIVTLDDLFRKTKATPRIYYLPLSEEQVAAKRSRIAKQ